jgi:predicted small lipoprotein YifL
VKTLLGAVVVLGSVLSLAACGEVTSASVPSASATLPAKTDAQVKAIMIENIMEFTTDAKGHPTERRDAFVLPLDIAYKDHTLYVNTRLIKGKYADETCNSVAAVAHDPDTAKSLGVHAVILIANGHAVTDCKGPDWGK